MKKLKTSWDLSPLFKSDTNPAIEKQRKKVLIQTNKFVRKWKSRSDFLRSPKILKQALDDFEYWTKYYGPNFQEDYYFNLRTSQDQNNPKLKALENKATEFSKKIENKMEFFKLRIAKIDHKLQKKFLNYKPLSKYRHFLKKLFDKQKHLLSEPEEKIMNLKETTSHTNWVRITSGLYSKEVAQVIDESGKKTVKNFSDLLGLMNSQKKSVRDSAAYAFNKILEKHLDVAEHEINSVLQNKKINDELRHFDRPDEERHISDDIETEVVDALVSEISAHFDIPKKFYQLKAKLMKVPKLAYHERNVEWGSIAKEYKFRTAVKILERVFSNLDYEFADIFRRFVEEGRVDVFPRKGKKNGAFCTYGLLIHPTYILLNWTNKLNDVLTFAHELGHGIHFELAKKQNALNFGTTISTAEVASTFTEDFVLQELRRGADDELKLALSMMKLNDEVSTIFRQIAFYNFEWELHEKFRKVGYLSKEEIGELFQKHMISYMGEFVEQSEGSQNWWTYVDHFRNFFYVYSYASGLLISKSLQASVKKDPKFISKVKEFLSAGTSDSPKNIFSKLSIDITDPKFWKKGISEIKTLLDETEKLAKMLGKIK